MVRSSSAAAADGVDGMQISTVSVSCCGDLSEASSNTMTCRVATRDGGFQPRLGFFLMN